MSATEELRRMLDERGIEHDDEFVKSSVPYCDGYEGTYWGGDSFGYVEPIRPKPNTVGSHPELTINGCTPEQAIAATLCETYTREECEAAFVRGYSLGSLSVGSSPQWDENRQTVDGHMAELGWVRAATLGGGKLTADDVRDLIERHSDAYVITMTPYFADDERYPSLIGVRADGDEFETAYVKKSDMAAAVDYWQRMYEETVKR